MASNAQPKVPATGQGQTPAAAELPFPHDSSIA